MLGPHNHMIKVRCEQTAKVGYVRHEDVEVMPQKENT